MNMNLPVIFGRLLLVLAALVGVINWNWSQQLEPTSAEIIELQRPCYQRDKNGRACEHSIRYATRTGAIFEDRYIESRRLPRGQRVDGLYHPDSPSIFRRTDDAGWKLVPFLLMLAGLGLGLLGIDGRLSGPTITPGWVTRSNRSIASARNRPAT